MNMYVVSATMRYFEQCQRPTGDRAMVEYIWRDNISQAWLAIERLLDSVSSRWQRVMLRVLLLPFGTRWITRGYRTRPVDLVSIGRYLQQIINHDNVFARGCLLAIPIRMPWLDGVNIRAGAKSAANS